MKYIHIIFPNYIKALLYRMGIMMLVLYICRILFLFFNWSFFDDLSFFDFILGFWFDLITVCILFLMYSPLYLLPLPWRNKKWYKLFFKLTFHGFNFFNIGLNLLDLEYFKFTQKRVTYDVFSYTENGDDLWNLIPTFIWDYWYLFLFAILLVVFTEWLYRKTDRLQFNDQFSLKFVLKGLGYTLVYIALIILVGRGVGLKPIGILTASKYTQPQNISFVLNSSFTVIKTWDSKGVELKNYFTEEELKNIYTPVRKVGEHKQFDQPNVVVLILESHSKEFIGYFHEGNGNTPFLDSLFGQSLLFTQAWANGKQSIEAMPSIMASIPSLMDRPFINSIYKTNPITSLPKLLKGEGYHSAFFHGATNGSMNFDGFCGVAEFDEYYGRTEYGDDSDYDGTWGIDDERFLQYSLTQINQFESPFLATVFTMYPHHPYVIPDRHEGKFKDPDKRLRQIQFANLALERFFKVASQQPWFENTLFVITADHTPDSKNNYYRRRLGMYAVPIAFYKPGKTDWIGENAKDVQQIDIMPSILDLLGYDQDFFAFGNSVFDPNYEGYAVQYTQNLYQIIENDQLIMFGTDDEVKHVFSIKEDTLLAKDLLKEGIQPDQKTLNKLKAIIQSFNYSMVNNELRLK
ncbi:MAG: sulfatase-like hydrolase/transferase [Crocinitomicaceae bacterium]